MSIIQSIVAREILDSRGHPTIEVEIHTQNNRKSRASVPSGASKGCYEALEKRDGGVRYQGMGVQQAVSCIEEIIAPLLKDENVMEHLRLDQLLITLDSTPDKSNLGANTLLAVSLAMARAAAIEQQIPLYHYLGQKETYCLPTPMINIINGGMHTNNNLDIQEFMILPTGAPTFKEALRYGAEVTYALKKSLQQKGLSIATGDEGGFSPNFLSHENAIEMILDAILATGLEIGTDINIALDLASSTFYREGKYHLALEKRTFSSDELIDHLLQWVKAYPIISIEDGMSETDHLGWQRLTARLGDTIQIVGDDLLVTSVQRLQESIIKKSANAILIKPNQVGTLQETLAAIKMAQNAKFATVISHRSGETEDTFIADLAVATQAGQIKAGALCRSERIVKYNQLLRIEEALGNKAYYAGKAPYMNKKMFKIVTMSLILLSCFLQFRFWQGGGSVVDVKRLNSTIAIQESELLSLTLRNQRLEAEVDNLKKQSFFLEERARYQLGMVKPGENFFQIVDPEPSSQHRSSNENIIK